MAAARKWSGPNDHFSTLEEECSEILDPMAQGRMTAFTTERLAMSDRAWPASFRP
jgi:hypothetical protein